MYFQQDNTIKCVSMLNVEQRPAIVPNQHCPQTTNFKDAGGSSTSASFLGGTCTCELWFAHQSRSGVPKYFSVEGKK